jgi:hypothetical protein
MKLIIIGLGISLLSSVNAVEFDVSKYFKKDGDHYVITKKNAEIFKEVFKENYPGFAYEIKDPDVKGYYKIKSEFKKSKVEQKLKTKLESVMKSAKVALNENKFCSKANFDFSYDKQTNSFFASSDYNMGRRSNQEEYFSAYKKHVAGFEGYLSLINSKNVSCSYGRNYSGSLKARCSYVLKNVPDSLGEVLEDGKGLSVRICTKGADYFKYSVIYVEYGVLAMNPTVEVYDKAGKVLWTGN